jgi:hypothetical protein
VRAEHARVGRRLPAELLERQRNAARDFTLVLQRREELGRQLVPREHLHVVAAQQQRALALPAKPSQCVPRDPRAVGVALAEHCDRIKQLAL